MSGAPVSTTRVQGRRLLLGDGVRGVATDRPLDPPCETSVLEDPLREDIDLPLHVGNDEHGRRCRRRCRGRRRRDLLLGREREGRGRQTTEDREQDEARHEGREPETPYPAIGRNTSEGFESLSE